MTIGTHPGIIIQIEVVVVETLLMIIIQIGIKSTFQGGGGPKVILMVIGIVMGMIIMVVMAPILTQL